MFEGLVGQLLVGYLGRYVKDIQKEKLKITFWNEEILLENVELILEAFDYLQLPFALKQGRVGRLSIKIPWKKLGWDPIIIILEDVYISASQRNDEEWSSDAVEKREFAGKKAKIAAAELAKLSRRVCDNNAGQSFISYITAKILDNIQISIRNFHVMFLDMTGDLGHIKLGLKFSSLKIMKQILLGPSVVWVRGSQVNKLVEIVGLEIYCSCQSVVDVAGCKEASGIKVSALDEKTDFILAPCDAVLSLVVNRSGKLDSSTPQYSVKADLSSLVFTLNDIQLQQILDLWDYLSICRLRDKYGRFRPWRSPLSRKVKGWQILWWHYAQQSVLLDVRKKLKKCSWRYLGQRLLYRRRYVNFYKKKLEFLHNDQIRLHIIAMHELCEFSKGEGFAEGFDAHLNIEQMNKTSVELFQMYDDHRKRGIIVPSEKEFRGYYALLKLDKHPGYKVEPAELSLDLAKMTPEMRQTAEVKFARDVARACRTSNFIAFFRLVRKASYLQACLMHAHFAKLRTQALASLHSGVQNNQGLPIAHVRKWIGMEEEDIEGLLEYHGFSIKVFEEPYMVREGPFLNSEKDFATKCSKLVHMKRSKMIVNDVSPKNKNENLISGATEKIPSTRKSENEYLIPRATKQIPLTRTKKESRTFSFEKISSPRPISAEKESSMNETDEEMTVFDDQLIPVDHKKVKPMIETSEVRQLHEYNHESNGALLQSGPRSCEPLRTEVKFVGNQVYDGLFMTSPVRNNSARMGLSLPLVSDVSHQKISACGYNDNVIRSVEPQNMVNNVMEDEEILNATEENKHDIVTESCPDEEIADARLKLILRLWRRRALKRKQLREQRLLAAKAAFSTLTVGPPIQLNNHKVKSIGIFDIDHIVRERWKRQKLSWSIVNVSEVVASILSRRNVNGKCICWKLVVCSQRTRDSHFAAGSWLLSKLMPSEANDLVYSSSFLSIWKSWLSGEAGVDLSCFLSIVRHVNFDNLPETVHGASGILFVATESIPLDLQRVQLHKLLTSIPSGSCLPLLILSDFHDEVSASLANKLDLYDIDRSRIHSFQVVSLLDNPHLRHLGFFSDEKLKEGLKWLANESPAQPVLHPIKVFDLIFSHLDSSMEVLDSMNEKDVSPNHCISAFNLALDQSVADITAAVKTNPSNWPCPEIALLESCNEQAFTTDGLPPVGWSLVENVEPLKQALMDLKLPTFPDMSWLTKCSNTIKEIPTVRDNLESCLRCYLSQTSEIMGQQLALEEAYIMLQKCAKLELHNFNYFIVPHWVTVFRRIFNWRLRYFPDRSSYVHIVDCCHGASVSSSIRLESREPPPYRPNQPLLDEVIEVACSSLSNDQERDFSEAHHPLATITSNSRPCEGFVTTIDFANDESNSTRQIGFVSSESVPNSGRELNCTGKEIVVSDKGYSEEARLKELLDRCNKRQDAIEKMLSIYF